MRPLDPILEKLSCAQTAFFQAADSVSSEQWKTKPKADEWTAAELVAHLVTAERAIIRRKSPIPLDPSLLNTKEEMLGELRAACERTLAFLEETSKRDLSTFCGRIRFWECQTGMNGLS
jgi:uncharacterized damage-inducible protein DinB